MEKVIGLVTCNYSAKESGPLSASRPVASMPFLGRYRLVDFALSNLVNSGIRTVGMVMPYNYRSLIDHVGSGKDWDLDRKNGGLFVLPGSAFGTSRTGARFLLRDLVHNKVFFTRSTADAVILTSANFVYNIDLDEVYAAHKESGADVTVVTRPSCGTFDDAVRFDVENGRVKGVHNGVKFGECMFLDCFVISRKLLLDMDVQDDLFPEERTVKTKAHDTPPAKNEVGSRVTNSRVSSGCRIYGNVSDSILGRDVIVEPGATVRSAIIMQGCVIKTGARVENAIVDRNNVVSAGTELRGTPEDVLVKEKPSE